MTNGTYHYSLKRLLAFDATTCVAMGALLLVDSGPIAGLTQIPAGLLFWAGASLIPIAAFMAISSRMTPVPGWAAALVVFGNFLWAAASILLPLAGLIAPNALGWALLIGQAAVVVVLGKLELDSLRGRTVTPDLPGLKGGVS